MTYFRTVKAPLVLGFVFLLASAAEALDNGPFPPASDPLQTASWLAEGGTRREGSAAESRVFDAVVHGVAGRTTIQKSGFRSLDGEFSFSQQLWFRVPGTRPGDLVVVVPTDGDNHRGVAWALAWADEALAQGSPVSLTFLFTGAERGQGPSAYLGSRTFLQDFYPPGPAAVLYLDPQNSESFRLTIESGVYPSPLWMVQGLSNTLDKEGLTPRFTGASPSLFRLDLPGRRNALGPWFERSIPGLMVTSGPPGTAMVKALEAFVAGLPQGVPADWDRHYLMFDFGDGKLFIGQRDYLVAFLLVSAVILFGYALLGRRRRGSLRVVISGAWQIPVLFSFGFLALLAGSEAGDFLGSIRGVPDVWKQLPLALSVFKALVAITLYLVLFLPFRRSPLSRNPDFYGQAALLWLGLASLASAALELSFSFYFLWGVVWAAVLVSVPWRPVKTLALVLGPVWLFKAAYDVLGPSPDSDLIRWALDSPLAGNIALDLLLFPFLLQVNAWHLWGHRHQDRNEGLRAGLHLTLWALVTLTVGVVVLRLPLSNLGPAPMPAVRHDLVTNPSSDDPLWKTTVSRSAFLDRTVWSVKFSGPLLPDEVGLSLVSSEDLIVYDCTFPVVLAPDGHSARIVVGRQPPLPLLLTITLPRKTRATLQIGTVILFDRRYEVTDAVTLGP
jgi:hypothetical protein